MRYRDPVSPARAVALLSALAAAPVAAASCELPTSGLASGSSGSGASGGAASSSSSSGSGGATGGGGAGGSAPACATRCEALPVGWTLVRARLADPTTQPDAAAPSCMSGDPAGVYVYGPVPAACTDCACGEPMGASCNAPQITCSYTADDCSKSDLQIQDDTASCSTDDPLILFGNSHGSCALTAPATITKAGTCATVGGVPVPASPWTGTVVVCPQAELAAGAGCAPDEVCIPTGSTTDGAVCVTSADATTCPEGWTTTTTAAFEGGDDTRACSACACNLACEGGSYDVYTQDFCWGSISVTVDSTTCTPAPGVFDWSTSSLQSHQATPKVMSCDGAVPSGSVAPTGPHQICCR
jgi:hypothetical protein